jgi:hypothetical protein
MVLNDICSMIMIRVGKYLKKCLDRGGPGMPGCCAENLAASATDLRINKGDGSQKENR